MVTIREFLDACKVLNTFCREHKGCCAKCPVMGVCRVGVPNVTLDDDSDEDEVD